MDVIGDAPARRRPWPRLAPWQRRGLAVVGMAALLGYVLTHRTAPPAEPGPAQPPASTPTPEPGPPPVLTGRVGLGPPGLRVLPDDRQPRILDLHTGRLQPIPGLPGDFGRDLWSVLPFRDGLLAYVQRGDTLDCYLLRRGRPPRLVVRDGVVVPSVDGGLVVLHNPAFPQPPQVSGQTLDGRVQWRWPAPPGMLLMQDTTAGVLLDDVETELNSNHASTVLLLERTTGRVLRRFAGPLLVVGEDTVAHAGPGCDRGCRLVVTRLDTGASTSYSVPTQPAVEQAAYAPGGRRLAVTVPSRAGPRGPTTVAVLDLVTGELLPVPGLATPHSRPPRLAWSADGQWLLIAVPDRDATRIALWRPDRPAAPLTLLPSAYPGEPEGMLVGVP